MATLLNAVINSVTEGSISGVSELEMSKSLVREYVKIVDELNMFKQCDYEGVGVIYHYYNYPPQS
jgi:hypothetical protein